MTATPLFHTHFSALSRLSLQLLVIRVFSARAFQSQTVSISTIFPTCAVSLECKRSHSLASTAHFLAAAGLTCALRSEVSISLARSIFFDVSVFMNPFVNRAHKKLLANGHALHRCIPRASRVCLGRCTALSRAQRAAPLPPAPFPSARRASIGSCGRAATSCQGRGATW